MKKIIYFVTPSKNALEGFKLFIFNTCKKLQLKFKVGMLITVNKKGEVDVSIKEFANKIPILVDNGAFRYGQSIGVEQLKLTLLNLCENYKIYNFKLIAPDVLENPLETVELTIEFFKNIPLTYWQYVIPVLQGKTVDDYLLCFSTLISKLPLKYMVKKGVRILAIGGLKKKNYNDKIKIINEVHKIIKSFNPLNYKLKLHILGGDLQVIKIITKLDHVYSIDTTNWMYGITKHLRFTIANIDKVHGIRVFGKDINRISWGVVLAHEIEQYALIIDTFFRKGS